MATLPFRPLLLSRSICLLQYLKIPFSTTSCLNVKPIKAAAKELWTTPFSNSRISPFNYIMEHRLPESKMISLVDYKIRTLRTVKPNGNTKVMSQIVERKRMQVETDPAKLVTYLCGSNIYNTGDDVKLKSDSEYPDWLWKLRTERGSPPLEELDHNTPQYWRIVKRQQKRRESLLRKTRNKFGIY